MTQPENQPTASIPHDNLKRKLTHVHPDDPALTHLAVVGDTYTFLITGADTEGRYCLMDMIVPPEGGPPPHRHDCEEMFSVLEGEIEFTFRGQKQVVRAGETINIPANAPHAFKNVTQEKAHLLCLRAPAGQEEMFLEIGDPLATRTSPPPHLSDEEKAERGKKAEELASKYQTEMIGP